MALTTDIFATYRNPGAVVKRRLGRGHDGRGEGRALVTLMLACALIFVAQWPRLSRESHLNDQPFELLAGGALFGWLFVAPLVLYALAGLSHAVWRLFGGRASYLEARMALFWGLLAAVPFWLVWGIVTGLAGEGALQLVAGALALAAFLAIWLVALWSVERRRDAR